jgi:hypothetical protein
MYSAMMVTFDCSSPTQKPCRAWVVKKKRRDRSTASVTRLIHSRETGASASMAKSGCVVMGDLLHVVDSGTLMAVSNLWPPLTHLFLDTLRQVGNLGQPSKSPLLIAEGAGSYTL